VSAADAERMLRLVASEVLVELPQSPSLSAKLPPPWGARLQAAIPPIVDAPVFALRKPARIVFSLDDYVGRGILTAAQRDALECAVLAHDNILIGDGTGSGKTTFANAHGVPPGSATHAAVASPSRRGMRRRRRPETLRHRPLAGPRRAPNMPFSDFLCLALFLQAPAVHPWRLARDAALDEQDARIVAGNCSDKAKHAVHERGSLRARLAALLLPLALWRKPTTQVDDVLAGWAAAHREGQSALPIRLGASAVDQATAGSTEPEGTPTPATSPSEDLPPPPLIATEPVANNRDLSWLSHTETPLIDLYLGIETSREAPCPRPARQRAGAPS
jgi:hypothetical protein